jgi:predicted transcriptional regulator
MKCRSRTEIAAQILQAASESITRTWAMYNAFVSYSELKDYLAILMGNGFLEYDSRLQTYRTTEKGLIFLRAYHDTDGHLIKIPPLERDVEENKVSP